MGLRTYLASSLHLHDGPSSPSQISAQENPELSLSVQAITHGPNEDCPCLFQFRGAAGMPRLGHLKHRPEPLSQPCFLPHIVSSPVSQALGKLCCSEAGVAGMLDSRLLERVSTCLALCQYLAQEASAS